MFVSNDIEIRLNKLIFLFIFLLDLEVHIHVTILLEDSSQNKRKREETLSPPSLESNEDALAHWTFKALLLGSFKESQTKEIILSDPLITPENFKLFLCRYIYIRKCSFINFHLARIYDFPSILKYCENLILNKLSPQNCIFAYNSAKLFQMDQVVKESQSIKSDSIHVDFYWNRSRNKRFNSVYQIFK